MRGRGSRIMRCSLPEDAGCAVMVVSCLECLTLRLGGVSEIRAQTTHCPSSPQRSCNPGASRLPLRLRGHSHSCPFKRATELVLIRCPSYE